MCRDGDLSIKNEDVIECFQAGIGNLTALSLGSGYTIPSAAPHLIIGAFKNLAGAAIAADYYSHCLMVLRLLPLLVQLSVEVVPPLPPEETTRRKMSRRKKKRKKTLTWAVCSAMTTTEHGTHTPHLCLPPSPVIYLTSRTWERTINELKSRRGM